MPHDWEIVELIPQTRWIAERSNLFNCTKLRGITDIFFLERVDKAISRWLRFMFAVVSWDKSLSNLAAEINSA